MSDIMKDQINEIICEARQDMNVDPKKSYRLSKYAYELSKASGFLLEEGNSLLAMALCCRYVSNVSKFLDYSYQGLKIFKSLNNEYGKMRSFNLIGISYFYYGIYDKALNFFLESLEISKTLNDEYFASCILNNIGEIYMNTNDNINAYKYYNEAYDICEKNNFDITKASILINLGNMYIINGEYDKALSYLLKSYDISINKNDLLLIGETENKIGEIYLLKNDSSKAFDFYFQSLNHLEYIHNKFYLIDTLTNIGKLYLKTKSETGLFYLTKAITYGEEINASKKLSEIFLMLTAYYEEKDDFKLALDYYKKYHEFEKELSLNNITYKLEMLKIEFENDNKSKKLKEFINLNNNLISEISKQNKELEQIKNVNKSLKQKALNDALTQIPNRYFINTILNEIWSSPDTYKNTISFFVIDIDRFKFFNDYWGHIKGDYCLVKIAKALNNITCNVNGFLGRFGGEEFVFFAQNLSYSKTKSIAETMRSAIENLSIQYTRDDNSKFVSVSIGCVIGLPSYFSSMTEMIDLADKELYIAKSSGRNMVSINNLIENNLL